MLKALTVHSALIMLLIAAGYVAVVVFGASGDIFDFALIVVFVYIGAGVFTPILRKAFQDWRKERSK